MFDDTYVWIRGVKGLPFINGMNTWSTTIASLLMIRQVQKSQWKDPVGPQSHKWNDERPSHPASEMAYLSQSGRARDTLSPFRRTRLCDVTDTAL